MHHENYIINDLKSNQEHFAKFLQYVSCTGCLKYEEKADEYDKYKKLMSYCEAIIINREIPKYVQEELGEEFLSKRTIFVNKLKFEPETFGEIRYVDEILNLPEYKKEKLKAVAIAQFWKDYENKDVEILKLKKEIEDLKKTKSKKSSNNS